MIENSRYSIKPKKLIPSAAEAVCRVGVVVVVLQNAVVEVFKASQNVLHLEIKHHVVVRSTGGARGDGNSRRCEVAVNSGVPCR